MSRSHLDTGIIPAEPGFNAIFVYTLGDKITNLMPIPIVAWMVRGQFNEHANRAEAKPIWVDFDWCLGDPLAIQTPAGDYILPGDLVLHDADEVIDHLQSQEQAVA
jgi:hypothetical protein